MNCSSLLLFSLAQSRQNSLIFLDFQLLLVLLSIYLVNYVLFTVFTGLFPLKFEENPKFATFFITTTKVNKKS